MSDFVVHAGGESADACVSCAVLDDVIWSDWSMCSYDEDIAIFRFHWPDHTGTEPDWQSLLQPDEIQRAGRYRRKEDRYRSLYARSLLRILAGTYTNQPSATIRLIRGVTQKPALHDNTEWHINAAHSGNWILLAMSRVSVGVDVEKIALDFPFQDVTTHSFSLPEQQYIRAGENARLRFYQLWTRKEALVKATAKGIDTDFFSGSFLNRMPPGNNGPNWSRRLVDGWWFYRCRWVFGSRSLPIHSRKPSVLYDRS